MSGPPFLGYRTFGARAAIAFAHDVAMAAVSFPLALALRVGFPWAWSLLQDRLLGTWLLFVAIAALVFFATGLYRGIWRYASQNDLVAILRAVTIALLIFTPLAFLLARLEAIPRTFLFIEWLVLVFLLGAPRMLYQLYKTRSFTHILERDAHLRVPVLLVGAGDEAESFIRTMSHDRTSAYEVLGVVAEKGGGRVGRQIRGVPVLGELSGLEAILADVKRRNRPPQRIVVTREIEGESIAELLAFCEEQGLTLARLPRLTDFQSQQRDGLAPRPVALEDLLRRPTTVLDAFAPRRFVEGRRVLVTGAGGSIGAELARQLVAFGAGEITLLDMSEYLLYAIDLELAERAPKLPRRARLVDVRDAAALDAVFSEAQPEIVFHAAALKHVPLVEMNPEEGVLTNVLGTREVARACQRHGVRAMVLISTDKAVNPSSVMGTTKRLAESYCQALDVASEEGAATRFVAVRFGNVLGSTGSVVPLFQRQLARGGPLTVTDPRMTRYFMTLQEAVRLVLQAAAKGADASMAGSGRIFVLDMGSPVRILDLAEQMIRLAGKRPYKDVDIVFTGLRPGEKQCEELFHDGEPLIPSGEPGLLLAEPRRADLKLLDRSLLELEALARTHQRGPMLRLLQRLVPEYSGRPEKEGDKTAAVS